MTGMPWEVPEPRTISFMPQVWRKPGELKRRSAPQGVRRMKQAFEPGQSHKTAVPRGASFFMPGACATQTLHTSHYSVDKSKKQSSYGAMPKMVFDGGQKTMDLVNNLAGCRTVCFLAVVVQKPGFLNNNRYTQ
jgi:hypothetical protein